MKIPQYKPRSISTGRISPNAGVISIPRRPPALRADASAFTSPGTMAIEGIGQMAGISSEFAQGLEEAKKKRDQQDELDYVLDAEGRFQNDSIDYFADAFAKTGRDTYGNVNAANIHIEELIEKYQENAPSDNARIAIADKIRKNTRASIARLATLQVGERKKVHLNTITALSKSKNKSAYLGLDSPAQLAADIEAAYNGGLAAGYFDDQTARLQSDAAQNSLYAAHLEGLIDRDPDKAVKMFESGAFTPFLTQDQIDQFADKIRTKKDTLEKDRLKAVDDAEKAAEKESDKQIDHNEFTLWQKSYAGTLTHDELESFASRRLISKEDYKSLKEALGKDVDAAVENNPVIVGNLSEMIELGVDVRFELKTALQRGQIKKETYISMKKNLANKEYKRGLDYISHAMKPTEADKWRPDRHLRYAEAVDSYNRSVSQGEAPDDASKALVDRYLAGVRRTFAGLPRPRLMKHDQHKNNPSRLDQAMADTVTAYDKGFMTESEYIFEVDLIEKLIAIAEEMEELTEQNKNTPSSDIQKRSSRNKKDNE